MINPTSHVITQFAIPTASADPSRHHGRARRQPLVHRRTTRARSGRSARRLTSFTSSPLPSPPVSPWASRPDPTATSGSPRGPPTRSASSSRPAGHGHHAPLVGSTSTVGMTVTFTATVSPRTAPARRRARDVLDRRRGRRRRPARRHRRPGYRQFTDSALGAGHHSITAAYSGDSAFSPSPARDDTGRRRSTRVPTRSRSSLRRMSRRRARS